MNIKDRFRELRRALQSNAGASRRKSNAKPRQLELSLPIGRRRQAAT